MECKADCNDKNYCQWCPATKPKESGSVSQDRPDLKQTALERARDWVKSGHTRLAYNEYEIAVKDAKAEGRREEKDSTTKIIKELYNHFDAVVKQLRKRIDHYRHTGTEMEHVAKQLEESIFRMGQGRAKARRILGLPFDHDPTPKGGKQ